MLSNFFANAFHGFTNAVLHKLSKTIDNVWMPFEKPDYDRKRCKMKQGDRKYQSTQAPIETSEKSCYALQRITGYIHFPKRATTFTDTFLTHRIFDFQKFGMRGILEVTEVLYFPPLNNQDTMQRSSCDGLHTLRGFFFVNTTSQPGIREDRVQRANNWTERE
jgi:hypothetical protein